MGNRELVQRRDALLNRRGFDVSNKNQVSRRTSRYRLFSVRGFAKTALIRQPR